ncbi:MAG: HlyD family secretion protein [Candidatus Melainabacteria bacterium]
MSAPTTPDTTRKPRNKWVLLATLLVLVAGSVWFFGFFAATSTVEFTGLLQAREVKNASRFGGRIAKILVKEGEMVHEGQPLITFDPVEVQSRLTEARAALSQANARLTLLEKGANTADLRQAKAALQQAQEHLYSLTSQPQAAERQQQQSRVDALSAQAQTAQQELTSGRKLFADGIISRQKLDALQDAAESLQAQLTAAQSGLKAVDASTPAEIRVARAQLEAARSAYQQLLKGAKPEDISIASSSVETARGSLKALEGQLEEVELRAPISGYVSVIAVGEGELVQPGQPVISLIDYNDLWSNIYVPESKLDFLQVGKPVLVKAVAYKNKTFPGRIAMINPKSEFVPNSGGSNESEESSFRVKIQLDPAQPAPQTKTGAGNQLYPGMKITVFLKK